MPFQYVAHCLNFDLQQVSLTLNNGEGRLVDYFNACNDHVKAMSELLL